MFSTKSSKQEGGTHVMWARGRAAYVSATVKSENQRAPPIASESCTGPVECNASVRTPHVADTKLAMDTSGGTTIIKGEQPDLRKLSLTLFQPF